MQNEAGQGKIRVLVVDDSAFMRLTLRRMLEASGDIAVVGAARDGKEGVALARELSPDVVTLDVEMPRMNGLQALLELLGNGPLPVVMVSSLTTTGAAVTLKALELGAVDFVAKPSSIGSGDISLMAAELVAKVRAAARLGRDKILQIISDRRKVPNNLGVAEKWTGRFDLVVIGSSTGGPPALRKILSSLPPNLPCGILVAQHMPPGFTRLLAERLNESSKVKVKEAEDGDVVTPGSCFVASAGYQTLVEGSGDEIRLRVTLPGNKDLYKPCVDLAMFSAANVVGERTLGVLLTGMGADGANGLKAIKDRGGFTIAEAEESCVVYGMPAKAVELGAAVRVLPLEMIASEICAVL